MDLRTKYLGLPLRTPLVASASPLSEDLSKVRRLEDAGASAIVLFSLFEEQLMLSGEDLDEFIAKGTTPVDLIALVRSGSVQLSASPLSYLEHIHASKEAVDIPIIASLNGTPNLRWTRYARLVEQAGADAIELNFYYLPTDPNELGEHIEARYVEVITEIKNQVSIPIAVKLSPYFTNLAATAHRFQRAGADGLVLFNRFYHPDIDLQHRRVLPRLHLSHSHELLLALRWLGALYDRTELDLAATGGVHTSQDVLKAIAVGARVVELASVLLRFGVEHLSELETQLKGWMEGFEIDSIESFCGQLSQARAAEPQAYERAQYMRTLASFDADAPR